MSMFSYIDKAGAKHTCSCLLNDKCDGCAVYKNITGKQTNADRIRSMTDEELAFYIVNHPMWSDEDACVEWLKSPVEVDE